MLRSVVGGSLKQARARRSITGSVLPTASVSKQEAIPARSQTLTEKGAKGGKKGKGRRVRWALENAIWIRSYF